MKQMILAVLTALAFSVFPVIDNGKTGTLPAEFFPIARAILPECATEDSEWCLWDETPSGNPGYGNGRGESFISLAGEYGIIFD